MDMNTLIIWDKFKDYMFVESSHEYYYKEINKVKTSVTQFIKTFFEEFDRETISKEYARKHSKTQEQVLADGDRKGLVSREVGTLCHAYLENLFRGKILDINLKPYLDKDVNNEIAEKCIYLQQTLFDFYHNTISYITPLKTEFTVGIEDKIAGNIDLLVYNHNTEQIEIWDYKFIKELAKTIKFKDKKYGKYELEGLLDCNFIHYSFQLNLYKEMLKRKGINVGACRLIYFNIKKYSYEIVDCMDLQLQASKALDRITV